MVICLALALVLLSVEVASAQRSIVTVMPSIDCRDTSTLVADRDVKRDFLILVNDSDTVIYIGIGADAIVGRGPRLNANGGNWVFDIRTSIQAIYCIHGTADGHKNLTVTRGRSQP